MTSHEMLTRFGVRTTVPPPYACRGTTLWAFLVPADREQLHEICERAFTIPTTGAVRYEPLSRHVLFTFGHIPHITSLQSPFHQEGEISESHAGIWMMVRRVSGTGPRVAVFNPFMWVDNPVSLVGGREYFGYAKSWGELSTPANRANSPMVASDVEGHDTHFTLRVLGGNQHEPRTMRPLLAIAKPTQCTTTQHLTDAPISFDSLRGALAHASERVLTRAQQVVHLDTLLEDLSELVQGSVPQVFCKQTPSPQGDGTGRVELCAADITVTSMRGEMLFDDHLLTVHPLFSDPVAGELGLEVDATGTHQRVVKRGFFVESMDMTLEQGHVFWDSSDQFSGGRPAPGPAPCTTSFDGPPSSGPSSPPSTAALDMQAARAQIDSMCVNPWMRMQVALDFYPPPTPQSDPFDEFRTAQSAFMMWELIRGVLYPPNGQPRAGSAWWCSVNRDLLAEQLIARHAWHNNLELPVDTNGAKWLAFLREPTTERFYNAHNSSIVSAYLAHAALATHESEHEQALINQALARVLLVQAITAGEPILGGRWTMKIIRACGGSVGDVVQLAVAVPQLYPPRYPLPAPARNAKKVVRAHHPLRGLSRPHSNSMTSRFLDRVLLGPRLRRVFRFAEVALEQPELGNYLSRNGRYAYPHAFINVPSSSTHQTPTAARRFIRRN